MSKPKAAAKQKKARVPDTPEARASGTQVVDNRELLWTQAEQEDELTLGNTDLLWEDRQLLARVARFLFSIVHPRFLRRAIRLGYTRAEHMSLWAVYDTAAGRHRQLDDSLNALVEGDPERKRLLLELDAFENEQFPNIANLILRYAPRGEAEIFRDRFFENLSQQPLGVGVLDSVATLLDRVDGLATSKWPGAPRVLAAIRSRRVTEALSTELRAKIKALRDVLKPGAGLTEEQKAQVAAQKDALVELRLAWNDWSGTLRPHFNQVELVQLGIAQVSRTPAAPSEGGGGTPGGTPSGGGAQPTT